MNFRIPSTEDQPEMAEYEKRDAALKRLAAATARFGKKFDSSKYKGASAEDINKLAEQFEESELLTRKPVKQDNPAGLDLGIFDPYNPAKYMKSN
jgi:hypothetical protein